MSITYVQLNVFLFSRKPPSDGIEIKDAIFHASKVQLLKEIGGSR
jgi:hypothetical protein